MAPATVAAGRAGKPVTVPAPRRPTHDDTDPPPVADRRRWSWLDVLFLAGFLAFGCWLCARYFLDVDRRISAVNPDDSTLFEWWFAHGARVVSHGENPFFSVQQGAPVGVNVATNASLLGLTLPL